MKNRVGLIVGAITLALLVTGVAWAAQDADSTVNVALAENQDVRIPVSEAGVVLLHRAGGSLEIVSVTPNNGYTVQVEVAVGAEVEAEFRGNGQRVQFNAELEDGIVRVRIRAEADAAIGSTASTVTMQIASTSTSAAAANGSLQLGEGQTVEVAIADAGFVLLRRSGDALAVVSTRTNAGWVAEVEVGQGREIEGDFRNGARRVKFNFELENGLIRVRIESENSTSVSTSTTGTTNTTAPTSTTGTSTIGGIGIGLPVGSVTYDLNGAGTVTILFANETIVITSINPAAGWSVAESEEKGDEIDVELTNGDEEAELRVRIESGELRVEVERKD